MIEGRPRESLVLYEAPIELGAGQEAQIKPFQKSFGGSMKKGNTLPPLDNKPLLAEDILNTLLPPREWIEQGKHIIQYVSPEMATRIDVARLRELLDQKLLERQSRETGLCPVREELFGQCFDEIIRQVTLNEPVRGLLLTRVRDQIKMTNQAYQTLYQSAVTFAMRKQLQAEHGKEELEQKIKVLEEDRLRMQNRVHELRQRILSHKTRSKERRAVDKVKLAEEKKFLEFQRDHLSTFFKQIEDK